MIKQNALNWLVGKMSDATSAVFLSHNIDFLFVQSILVPRLRRIGHPRLTIFADAACAAHSFNEQHPLLSGLGTEYRVVPVDLGAMRRFHPKALYLAGPKRGALCIGSGNLTHGGMSANREIWHSAVSDDAGAESLAAFRSYLLEVLSLVPINPAVEEEVRKALDPVDNNWVDQLPDPSGLCWSPASRTLLDQIIDSTGSNLTAARLLAPYYDADGAALGALARRVGGLVDAFVQAGHEGLSQSAAASVPPNVRFCAIDEPDNRFIHAKVFGIETDAGNFLVAGSANLSRAALTSAAGYGNAELVVVREVTNEEADACFEDFLVHDDPPDFPKAPPQDEWEPEAATLRIQRVSFVEGELEIVFSSPDPITALTVLIDDREAHAVKVAGPEIRLVLSQCPATVRLEAGGLRSLPAWVDNETRLAKPTAMRRLEAKLAAAADRGGILRQDAIEILQLLSSHAREPSSHGGAKPTKTPEAAVDVKPYDAGDVFAEGFGAAPVVGGGRSGVPTSFDFLRTFRGFFLADSDSGAGSENHSHLGAAANLASPAPEDEEGLEGDEEHDERSDAGVLTGLEDAQPTDSLRRNFLKTAKTIADTLVQPHFVASHDPRSLGKLLSGVALMLRFGVTRGLLDFEDFANVTMQIWSGLFFGPNGSSGTLPRHIDALSEDERDIFYARLATPQFSAALTLWAMPAWRKGATVEHRQLRYGALVLVARYPNLLPANDDEHRLATIAELDRWVSGKDGDGVLATWRRWLRFARALREFESAAECYSAQELAALAGTADLAPGNLLWQARSFATVLSAPGDGDGKKVEAQLFLRASPAKFALGYVCALRALIHSSSLELRLPVRDCLIELLDEFEEAKPAQLLSSPP